MSLLRSFEKSGLVLFKYRGQIPIVLFLLAVPAIYYMDYSGFSAASVISIKIAAVFICALGLGIRIYTVGTAADYTSGRNREEQVAESLNTTGIYSIVRHPLYLGNYLMWAGILIYTMNPVLFTVVSLFFWLYYERIMFAEERFLEKKFGEQFLNWSAVTPAFLPSFKKFVPAKFPFKASKALKEYSGVLAAVASIVVIQTLQDYFTYGKFLINYISVVVVLFTLLLVGLIKYFIIPKTKRNRHIATYSVSIFFLFNYVVRDYLE